MYGVMLPLQFVMCSLVNPKESIAFLFFRFLIAFLISSYETGCIGWFIRRQISSICTISNLTLSWHWWSNKSIWLGVERSSKFFCQPVQISLGDSKHDPCIHRVLVWAFFDFRCRHTKAWKDFELLSWFMIFLILASLFLLHHSDGWVFSAWV